MTDGRLKSIERALTEQKMLTRFYMAQFVAQVGRSVTSGLSPTHSPKKVGQVLERLASDLWAKRAEDRGVERVGRASIRTHSKRNSGGK